MLQRWQARKEDEATREQSSGSGSYAGEYIQEHPSEYSIAHNDADDADSTEYNIKSSLTYTLRKIL